MRALFIIGVLLCAQSAAADVAGAWKVDGSIGTFTVDLVCTFTQADKALTGTCKGTDIGELPIKGTDEGKTVTWSYDVNFQGQQLTVVYVATVESPTAWKGGITVMGNPSGEFTAKKQ